MLDSKSQLEDERVTTVKCGGHGVEDCKPEARDATGVCTRAHSENLRREEKHTDGRAYEHETGYRGRKRRDDGGLAATPSATCAGIEIDI